MADTLTPVKTDPAILRQRKDNQAVLEAYLAVQGGNAVEERMAFFHEEIVYEIMFTEDCMVHRTCGLDDLRERFGKLARSYGEYAYENITIFPHQDPDIFIAECDIRGTFTTPMFKEPRAYNNYCLLLVMLRDGKIWTLRQFANPMKLKRDFWHELPDLCK